MSQDQLRKDLAALRAECDRLDGMPGPARDRVQRLIADVEHRLEQAEDDEKDETLLDRIREELTEFEVEHPTVAAALETVMNTLSNAGI